MGSSRASRTYPTCTANTKVLVVSAAKFSSMAVKRSGIDKTNFKKYAN